MILEVFNPAGTTGVTAPFAPRLKSLDGKKIALLSNGHWQSDRTLALLQNLLQREFPASKPEIIAADEAVQDDRTIDAIAADAYDAAIVGNAA